MFSVSVTVICLVLAERCRRENIRYTSISDDDVPTSISGYLASNSESDPNKFEKYDSLLVFKIR